MNTNLQSTYKNYTTRLTIKKSRIDTNIVFVNIHGSFGESGDKGSKSLELATILQKELSHVVYISTSRNWDEYKKLKKDDQYKAFSGKTFEQERQDVIDSIKYILANSKRYFDENEIKLYICASSSGGTVAATLAEIFPHVKKLVLCNSGIQSISKDKPILSSIPTSNLIKDSASKYTGELLFLKGTDDDLVPADYKQQLFNAFCNAKSKMKVIQGANHNFSAIFGKNKEKAREIYINEVVEFFRR